MNKKNLTQKYLPYIVAIVLFTLISSLYFIPVFQGKVIFAGDDIQANAAVHESVKYHEDTGEYTWWTGSMFAGMPNYQVGGGRYLSGTLLRPLHKLTHPSANKMHLVFITFFCCFFALLRSFGINKWLSIVGALATGFSSYFFIIEAAGQNGKAWAIMLMSVVIGGFYLIFHKKYGWGVALTLVFTSIGYYSHIQMAYYIFMFIGVLFVAELIQHIKEKRYKDFLIATALFAGSVIVGMGTGCASIFANKEYAAETMRGGHSDLTVNSDGNKAKGLSLDYITHWSYGIDESLTFLIPGFKGTASGYDVGTESVLYDALIKKGVDKTTAREICSQAPTYWGEQPFTVGSVYAGAAVCLLFVLGLLLVKGPYKWGLLAVTVFSFILSWGKNWMWLTELFYNWFPMYNKFRAVASILIVAEISMPLLGFLAVNQIMSGQIDKKRIQKALYISTSIVGGICLILALFGGSLFSFKSSYDASEWPDWLYSAVIDQRASMLRSDSFRSFMFVVITAVVIWLFSERKISKNLLVIFLGVIVLADMWPVDKRFLNDDNFVSLKQKKDRFAMQSYEKAILADDDPHYRVFNLAANTFNEARTSYYFKSLGGYCAAKLRRYQDIIDEYLSKADIHVASMLNAKYIITSQDGKITPMRNPAAMGNAWFVSSLFNADDSNQECAALGEVDLSSTIVVGNDFKEYVNGFKPAAQGSSITLTSYAPDVLTYKSESSADGTVVFSEIYYPYGWKAYIDGKPADIFRANYLLRAMNIPAGQHDIRMEFRPDSVRKGNIVSGIFVGIMYATLLGLIAGTLIKRGRQRKSA